MKQNNAAKTLSIAW